MHSYVLSGIAGYIQSRFQDFWQNVKCDLAHYSTLLSLKIMAYEGEIQQLKDAKHEWQNEVQQKTSPLSKS